MEVERRGRTILVEFVRATRGSGRNRVDEPKSKEKPFSISKRLVWEAYQRVKANKGAPGVDGCSIEDFEKDLKNNLYKIWNRMSSGSYFPPPVRAVAIPKRRWRCRVLGVPTVADRIAQTVVAEDLGSRWSRISTPTPRAIGWAVGAGRGREVPAAVLEERLGGRPGHPVLLRQRRSHALIVKAVEVNTDQPWVVLYVKRWLQAPVQKADGTLAERHRGTPQGSAVSPVLANLFLHYAFDAWMARTFPAIRFERYVDDAVVHCVAATSGSCYAMLSVGVWPRSGWSYTRQDQDRLLSGHATGERATIIPRSRSWGIRSVPATRRTGRDQVTGFHPL